MRWASLQRWFEGTGVPITPTDDAGRSNPYPMFRLVARDANGTQLAATSVVVPVSSEMDCRACHASGTHPSAMPDGGWQNDPNDKRDFRLNILRPHDQHHSTSLYNSQPVLCAQCHASEALPGTGVEGVPPLTQAMHARRRTATTTCNRSPSRGTSA